VILVRAILKITKRKIMSIKLNHISVKKGTTTILTDINLEIKTGESWAIIGENGSGKTTLLQLLAGYSEGVKGLCERQKDLKTELVASSFKTNRLVNKAYQYYQQRYTFDGAALAPTIYEVVQNQVKPLNTVDEKSVTLPPKPYTDVAIEEWANILKINHLLDHKIVTLSNGETHRVHLLMALLKQPHILLLDNPFIGLDVDSRHILHNILNHITTRGIQIIIVCAAAEMPECITNAVVLKDGKMGNILRGAQISEHRNAIENKHIFQILLNQDLLTKIKEKPTFNDFSYAVRFRNTTIQYGNEKVVNNVSWDVRKGERWALLGPNGSGKSSLLSLITADNPQGYRNDFDLFDRKRGSGESIWQIKKRIGFVSPELHLYADAHNQVWKIIASGLFDVAALYKSLTVAEAQTVADYIKLFSLEHVKDKLLYQLSSGQQRSVFLARALVKNPPLLILDEPCQGLDAAHIAYFRDLVNDIVISMDKTLIYVTHYESEIPACVSQIFRIKNGKRI
jgi:molybdate transport system ATP-binding protein